MKPVTLVLLGAALGLTWAAALRAFMIPIAGPQSSFDWFGTFALILAPGLVVGALLGWAEHIRRTGGRRGWRWLALAPMVFPIVALSAPGAFVSFITTGIGGGALGVAVIGMLGGYAMSRRGPLPLRIVCGSLALIIVPSIVLGTLYFLPALAVTTPRGAWFTVLSLGLMFVLALAASIPHRAVEARTSA